MRIRNIWVMVICLLVVLAGIVIAWFVPPHKKALAPAVVPQQQAKVSTTGPAAAPPPAVTSKLLFSDQLNGPDRIVTNEYAHWNPAGSCPYVSDKWIMTSGTLLIHNGAGYSGTPTAEASPPCASTTQTNSAVFRLTTANTAFTNTVTAMDFRLVRHGGGGAPSNDYDGVHLWSRYRGEHAFYVASVGRWDGTVVIKKKVPSTMAKCADAVNGGCYYDLSRAVVRKGLVTDNQWHNAAFTVWDDANRIPQLRLTIDGQEVLTCRDADVHGPAYYSGAAGVRGDNTEFYFKNFTVTSP